MGDADKLLKVINKNYSFEPAVKSSLDELRGALKNAVLGVDDKGGVFAPAVKAASERFKLHDLIPALKEASRGKISPDKFVKNHLISSDTDEVNSLAQLLKNKAPESYKQMKSQIGDYLESAAFGINETGDKIFRPESFLKAKKRLGTEKLKAFFTDKEIDDLNRMGRVGAYIENAPAGSAVNTSNTSAQLVGLMDKMPVISNVSALSKYLIKALTEGKDINRALKGDLPYTKRNLNQKERLLLSAILRGSGVSGGLSLTPDF